MEPIAASGLTAREVLREKGTPYHSPKLRHPELTDSDLLDAMLEGEPEHDRNAKPASGRADQPAPPTKEVTSLPLDHQQHSQVRVVKGFCDDQRRPLPSRLPSPDKSFA
ncbi:hypothetical protein SLW56_08585 [Xanthomonas sp. LF07-6]|nr:hypothetical protein [Xanthomonas sp. LF07-6]MDY4339836.1 hypothetical protein [Xanthomonas sp. LF07-6]